MKKRVTAAAAAVLLLLAMTLASCGKTGTVPKDGGETQEAVTEKQEEAADPAEDNAGDAEDTEIPEENGEEPAETLDDFRFITEEDYLAFLQEYDPYKAVSYGSMRFTLQSGRDYFYGELLPDKKQLSYLRFETLEMFNDQGEFVEYDKAEYAAEVLRRLGAFIGESFEEAAEALEGGPLPDNMGSFETERYTVNVWPSEDRVELNVSPKEGISGLGVTLEDLRQFAGGPEAIEYETVERSVSLVGNGDDLKHAAGLYLDRGERAYHASAAYSGADPEDGKAFFEDFAKLFLENDTLSSAEKLIAANYDQVLAGGDGAGEGFAINLSLFERGGSMIFEIRTDDSLIPEDAETFPSAEKIAELSAPEQDKPEDGGSLPECSEDSKNAGGSGSPSVSEQVLQENDLYTLKAISLEESPAAVELQISLENHSEKWISVALQTPALNGWVCDKMNTVHVYAEPHQTATEILGIYNVGELPGYDGPAEISFTARAEEYEERDGYKNIGDKLLEDERVSVQVDNPAEVDYPDEGTELLSQDGIIVKYLGVSEDSTDSELKLRVVTINENDEDRRIATADNPNDGASYSSCTINGQPASLYMILSGNLPAHTRRLDTIVLYTEQMEPFGLSADTLETLSFTLHVIDKGWGGPELFTAPLEIVK